MRLVRVCVGVGVLAFSATICGPAVFGQTAPLPNLTSKLVVVRFSVVQGRIEATSNEPGFEREQTSTTESGRHESFSITTNNEEEASVKYELTSDSEQISLTVVDGFDVAISRHSLRQPNGATVEFHQPRSGPMTLSVEQDGVRRDLSGETIWYLLLAEPELCRQHLLPLMRMLRSDWRLAETAQGIEADMLRIAAEYVPENIHRWSRLVADMASERFIVRQAAERELRAQGSTVVPYLQSLDRHQLDLEQISRIGAIVASQPETAEDSADEEGCRLMDNRALWVILLTRPQESTRRVAARQLAFLLGTDAIQFDPGAAESVRQAQVDALRKRVESESAAPKSAKAGSADK